MSKPKSCKNCYATACLPDEPPTPGAHCWVAGWNLNHEIESNKLREKSVSVFSHEYCVDQSTYSYG